MYQDSLFSRGFDNTCHVDQDGWRERQAAAVAANMCHDGPIKPPWADGRNKPYRNPVVFPRSGLPSEAIARIEDPGLGYRGQNAGPAASGPNAANQGVYAAQGPFSGN